MFGYVLLVDVVVVIIVVVIIGVVVGIVVGGIFVVEGQFVPLPLPLGSRHWHAEQYCVSMLHPQQSPPS